MTIVGAKVTRPIGSTFGGNAYKAEPRSLPKTEPPLRSPTAGGADGPDVRPSPNDRDGNGGDG